MVAGYAIGGGHVLHLCCDLTIAADNARFGQTGPKRRLVRRRLRHQPARPPDRREAREGGLVPLPPVRRRDRPRVGSRERGRSRSKQLERTTVEWCREMLALSPLALRLLKAGSNAGTDGLAGRAAARGRRDAPLLHERGGAGRPRRLPTEARARLLPVPQAPVTATQERREPAPLWWRGARPRTLGRRARARRARHRGRGRGDLVAVRGGAARRRRAPDRRELRERLLRRRAWRRHARAARPAAAHGERRRPRPEPSSLRRHARARRRRGRGARAGARDGARC